MAKSGLVTIKNLSHENLAHTKKEMWKNGKSPCRRTDS
jgi:hypothetical protein